MSETNASAKAPRNWAALGLAWEEGVLQRQRGDNRSDRVPYKHPGQLPKIVDFQKCVDHFGKDRVLAWLNASNSLRVGAQAECRDLLEAGEKNPEVMRESVYAWMCGVRGRAAQVVKTVIVRMLPNGERYEGEDEVEFRSLYSAALVDLGLQADAAIAAATAYKWEQTA